MKSFNDLWARGPRPKREGYLLVDHRASPGIPADAARRMGYDPGLVGEGKVLEAATLSCAHCGTKNVINTNRTRERASCFQCAGKYICDLCDAERRKPDYVHRPMAQIIDMVGSGKFIAAQLGVRPLLIPNNGE